MLAIEVPCTGGHRGRCERDAPSAAVRRRTRFVHPDVTVASDAEQRDIAPVANGGFVRGALLQDVTCQIEPMKLGGRHGEAIQESSPGACCRSGPDRWALHRRIRRAENRRVLE